MPLVDTVTMSTPSSKVASDAGKPKDGLYPVHPLTSPVAQVVRHVQPVLLSGLFLAQFGSLVADPVPALYSSLPIVAAIQVVYAFVSLPAAGSQSAKPSRKPRPGEKKKAENTGPNPFIAIFLSLLLAVLVTPAIHIVLVLFGAPFLTHFLHTLLCSANIALLSLFPLFYAHGVEANTWVAIASASAPLDETYGGLVGGLLGAWLGAVPIPLDWDREWQKWPVTILCGLYAGHILGKTIGGTLAFGKKMASSAESDE
ncbi:GPI biosynthesis protein family Pig-F [Colletotrichum higginsianum]|uniref:GPI biosynthesis protein family Pig-F n=2 Tax=Colletotrichum higginsianum TaxID=80884 RepID=H1VAX4_COLHI|nr:GPI biosynthesis protein family Pig-F [Colletotrichum higginsianum IMI 349063]OBR07603.1 GPI biosynthesis protein family Pig-F [Colletotrichum higginsianum IMI 349063]TIC92446.1 Glycosylphosphatidylinositol anchor biosynthesis protein 11 [Colletotrichum higginsianum]CCF37377.1 GPI biosynthesis protein family Pig-F [Colletotrichum higginsianum]